MIRPTAFPGFAVAARSFFGEGRLRQALWAVACGAVLFVFVLTLLAVLPRAFGYGTFIVYGGSMEPAVAKGSVVVARPVAAASLQPGDVVLFRAAEASEPVMHRIVAVREEDGRRVFTLKGDANATADPRELELTGEGSKVVYALPLIGYVFHFAGSPAGRALAILLPTLYLTYWALRGIWSTKETPPPRG